MDFSEVKQIDAPLVNSSSEEHLLSTTSKELDNRNKCFSSFNKAWQPWYAAFKQAFPVYLAIHVAFLIISAVSALFTSPSNPHDPPHSLPISGLWDVWKNWDVLHYMHIAAYGYAQVPTDTAYFPLYPLLIRIGAVFTHSIYTSGLLIANLAGLTMLVVLYRLVEEEFDQERAQRTIIYISIFPVAFFFAAMYTESLFLTIIIAGFYNLRHGRWWIAGFYGLLAGLTRSAGILFALPFLYEYLHQQHFNLRAIRFNILSICLVPTGMAIFAFYCYLLFHKPFLFLQVEAGWRRYLRFPWHGTQFAIQSMLHSKDILNPLFIRNMLDILAILFVFAMLILAFIGPWRFSRAQWSFGIFAIAAFLFSVCFPIDHFAYPLGSSTRYLMVAFPVFIVMGGIGKNRTANLLYIAISGSLLFFFLLQFITGYWVT